ncbi:hypothetical protein AB0K74_34190 [Streptomyces sp. NPDC056159]|uniref:hypothetical protein n=1 Tax=unclassified Streptomyces TaxID=2593676 RepID=UPI003448A9AC
MVTALSAIAALAIAGVQFAATQKEGTGVSFRDVFSAPVAGAASHSRYVPR